MNIMEDEKLITTKQTVIDDFGYQPFNDNFNIKNNIGMYRICQISRYVYN